MRYLGIIYIEFDDNNDSRALTRVKEMGSWAAEGLEGAYGDGKPECVRVKVQRDDVLVSDDTP